MFAFRVGVAFWRVFNSYAEMGKFLSPPAIPVYLFFIIFSFDAMRSTGSSITHV